MKANLGDTVKVVDRGRLYSAYTAAAKIMGLIKWKCYYNNLRTDKEYLVLNDFNHLVSKKRLLGITDGEHDFIIGEEGVEVIEPKDLKETTAFSEHLSLEYFDINNLSI